MKFLKNEKGLSLLEVVASIVILTLVLSSFLGLILSAAKSTQQAKEVVDYTFIAQRNIELIYEKSSNNNLSDLDLIMTNDLKYGLNSANSTSKIYSKNIVDPNEGTYNIRVTFSKYQSQDTKFQKLSSSLNRVIVEVIPKGKKRPSAIVESLLEWSGTP